MSSQGKQGENFHGDWKFLTTSTFNGPSALKVSNPSPYSAPIAWKKTTPKIQIEWVESSNHFNYITQFTVPMRLHDMGGAHTK